VTVRAVADEQPWVRIARGELGQAEPLPGANPRIAEYRSVVGAPHGTDWCAAFMAWVLAQAGYSGPWTAAARSFLHVGEPCELKPGAIVVFWRVSPADWRGHVGICVRPGSAMVTVLGGNQGGAVSVRKYPTSRLLGARWPT
jgi:uncharacterized protein (TIGR02594 family)